IRLRICCTTESWNIDHRESMHRLCFGSIILLFAYGLVNGQALSWTKFTKLEAEKILNSSPWGQTQVETDTSEMMYSPTRPGTSAIGQPTASRSNPSSQQQVNNNRADQGATNEAISVNYRIRLLSAKPVREAIARMVMIERGEANPDLELAMQSLVDRDFS